MNNEEIITRLPKVDLHRHLEGSGRVKTTFESAIKHNFKLPTYDVNKLRKYDQVSPKCKSLTEFLKTFDFFYNILKFLDVV
jgi:adenosine deaminase